MINDQIFFAFFCWWIFRKTFKKSYPKIKYTPQNLYVSVIAYPNWATVVQLSLFLVLYYTTSPHWTFWQILTPITRSLEVTLYWIQGQWNLKDGFSSRPTKQHQENWGGKWGLVEIGVLLRLRSLSNQFKAMCFYSPSNTWISHWFIFYRKHVINIYLHF